MTEESTKSFQEATKMSLLMPRTIKKIWLLLGSCTVSLFLMQLNLDYNVSLSRERQQRETFEVITEEMTTAKTVKPKSERLRIQQHSLIVDESQYGDVKVEYMPIPTTCQVPAEAILEGYNNLCWCTAANSCKNVTDKSPSNLYEKGMLGCAPRIILLGIRKSGTTDLSGWFMKHTSVLGYNADFEVNPNKCVIGQALRIWMGRFLGKKYNDIYLKRNSLFNDAPGQILQHRNLGFTDRGRRLQVQSSIQHLQPIVTNKTRFILILRDPAERVVSQLFEWEKMHLMSDLHGSELTPHFVHNLVVSQIQKVNACFKNYGPAACIYMTPAKDGNRDALLLWGLYVEYLETVFKFIPREQLMVVKLEDYSRNEADTMRQVFEFAGLHYQNDASQDLVRLNKRRVVQQHNETIQLLREFYKPFNRRLVTLLNDSKWCFSSC